MATKTAQDYAKTYTDPALRERLKEETKAGDKGGQPGQWSARKSQLLARRYKDRSYAVERAEAQNVVSVNWNRVAPSHARATKSSTA